MYPWQPYTHSNDMYPGQRFNGTNICLLKLDRFLRFLVSLTIVSMAAYSDGVISEPGTETDGVQYRVKRLFGVSTGMFNKTIDKHKLFHKRQRHF